MATNPMPNSRRKKLSAKAISNAEVMAIKAHDNLVSLGYGEEIEPLRLSNKRGTTAIIFASIAALIYGIGGFLYGMEINSSIQTTGFFFHFLDTLTIIAIIAAIISLVLGVMGLLKKHSSKIPAIVSFVVLVTAPLVFHILGVTAGLMMP